ncbi:NAD(+) diphosphatase [Reinekea marinisedimentorum]|uniref:NAD(+) diphosphatase n=1 Tax=Reinekea marinisedimentorum TaxID=230495 RepID=A0A4V2UIW0_9GAMM|nr:NUDIX domain-containing protein [Reinekea marinisedimentorum]TCS37680.1 NAD+ diphosphatase [Reinekea marinisedimentorum]
MKHCMECGSKLELKPLRDEGLIPYCSSCQAFRFPVFNTAVSMVVLNESADKILLIQQYNIEGFILVAGYVSKGESAEQTVARELKEETGLDVIDMQFNKSEYFEKSNTLMLNFACRVSNDERMQTNHEIDHAQWFSIEQARENIRPGSLAQRFLEGWYANTRLR